MKYSELKELRNKKLNQIMDECQVFWSFNREGFDEELKKLNLDIKEVGSIGLGGYMPKINKDKYNKLDEELSNWFISEVKKIDKDLVIKYELNNYECFYTGDIEDAKPILLSYGYTQDDILNTYNKYQQFED